MTDPIAWWHVTWGCPPTPPEPEPEPEPEASPMTQVPSTTRSRLQAAIDSCRYRLEEQRGIADNATIRIEMERIHLDLLQHLLNSEPEPAPTYGKMPTPKAILT